MEFLGGAADDEGGFKDDTGAAGVPADRVLRRRRQEEAERARGVLPTQDLPGLTICLADYQY